MVVEDDDRGGVVEQGGAHHLAWVDVDPPDRAVGDDVLADQPAAAIEQQGDQLFPLPAAQPSQGVETKGGEGGDRLTVGDRLETRLAVR